jgi:hypothetical protein
LHTLKLKRPKNIGAFDFSQCKQLHLIELSYTDSEVSYSETEICVKSFFEKIRNLSNVKKVRICLKKLNQEAITEIIIDNYNRGNIHDVLEFQVEKLVLQRTLLPHFEDSPLSELFDIKQATCQKIEGV